VDRIPARDCRGFLEFLQFNEPRYADLTQLVVLMDSKTRFFVATINK
jgi:hypothetical protein